MVIFDEAEFLLFSHPPVVDKIVLLCLDCGKRPDTKFENKVFFKITFSLGFTMMSKHTDIFTNAHHPFTLNQGCFL